jgi:hypothetical protein
MILFEGLKGQGQMEVGQSEEIANLHSLYLVSVHDHAKFKNVSLCNIIMPSIYFNLKRKING